MPSSVCAAFNFQLLPAAAELLSCNKRNAALLWLLQLQVSEPGFCFKCFMAKRMQELPCNRYKCRYRYRYTLAATASTTGTCNQLLHTHTHIPTHPRHGDSDTHAFHFQLNCPLCLCLSLSPSLSACLSLSLFLSTTTTKRKAKQSTVENEVGKLHGTLHATPARIGCSTQPLPP